MRHLACRFLLAACLAAAVQGAILQCKVAGCAECGKPNRCKACRQPRGGSEVVLVNNKCLSCAKDIVADPLCMACYKPAGVNPATKKKECKSCAAFSLDSQGSPAFPVYKNKAGVCTECTKCPYSKGWESCDRSGACKACRTADGFVLKNGQCTKPPPPPDCTLPSEVGPCKGAFTRWFFNAATQKCERFSYGGCGGNSNNFKTVAACKKACPPAVDPSCPEPVQCFADPCMTKTCPTGQKCRADYCHGGCDAICEPCKPVNCLLDPCDPRIAPKCADNEQCQSDYCGGCNAKCVAKPDNPCVHPAAVAEPLCQNDTCAADERCVEDCIPCGGCRARCVKECDRSACATPPCQLARCTAETVCVDDYCPPEGTCTARCVKQETCDNPVQCLVEPCLTNRCTADQLCVNNYCGSCGYTCVNRSDLS